MYVRTCLLYLSAHFIFATSVTDYASYDLIYTTIVCKILSRVIDLILAAAEMLFFSLQLYRHGDRTPINPYPNDPYKNNSFWPVPWGELTDVSKLPRNHKIT